MEWFLGWRDVVAIVLLPPLLITICMIVGNRLSYPSTLKRILFLAAVFHLSMSVAYALIYQLYYGYGADAFGYFKLGEKLYLSLFDKPLAALKVLITPSYSLPPREAYEVFGESVTPLINSRALPPAKLSAIFYPLGLGSFIGVSFFFSMVAFFARWLIFSIFRKMYQQHEKVIALATFFLPSVTFWAAAPLKDTVALVGVAIASWGLFSIIVEKKKLITSLLAIVLGMNMIYTSKPYVLYVFIPGAILWLYLGSIKHLLTPAVRIVLTPLVIAATVMLSFYLLFQTYVQQLLYQKFSEITQEIMEAQQWHYATTRSAYSLGEYTPTPAGILKILPAALIVALYRPWPWEATSLPALLNSVEGLGLLALTIWIFLRTGPLTLVRIVWQNPFIAFTLVWSLLFSAAMGFTSYSFGALSRYKVPGFNFVPLLLVILLIEGGLARKQKASTVPAHA